MGAAKLRPEDELLTWRNCLLDFVWRSVAALFVGMAA